MSLEAKIMTSLKDAMKAKDKDKLRGLRAIKAAILLAKTDGSGKGVDGATEIKLLQKLIKQRKDSLAIYEEQNREDLAVIERAEIDTIQAFLPKQLSKEELEALVQKIITDTGASSMKDMGRVMGLASKELAGKADNKTVSGIVRTLLNS